jgi:drug/metabolite transporter (DMT)-like permease
VPDSSSNPDLKPPKRRSTIFAAGLLLTALALVVLYTSRGAFMSPVALVVVAAIGLAALLLQLRLRQGLSPAVKAPLWLNVLGVVLAVAAVFSDALRLSGVVTLVAALLAVLCFALSGIIVIKGLRKHRA